MSCPGLMELVKFANNQLTGAEAEVTSRHIASCSLCSDFVKSLVEVKAGTQPTSASRPVEPAPQAPSPAPLGPSLSSAPPAPQREEPTGLDHNKAPQQSTWMTRALGLVLLAAFAGAASWGAYHGWWSGKADVAPAAGGDDELVGRDATGVRESAPEALPAALMKLLPADGEHQGFAMGAFADGTRDATPIESIQVTLEVGEHGEALREAVDLHLGLGFPLRLYPLGGQGREPAFAAFPQSSSVPPESNLVEPGAEADFVFSAEPDAAGLDALHATPVLLRGLTVGDLQGVGFASVGESDWRLHGYKILINGELYASHDAVHGRVRQVQEDMATRLQSLLPQQQAILQEIQELQAYVELGARCSGRSTTPCFSSPTVGNADPLH